MGQAICEHRQRLRLETLAGAAILTCMALGMSAGCFAFWPGNASGDSWIASGVWMLLSAAVAVGFASAAWRFTWRVLCVRRIHLLEPATLEIVLWWRRTLQARLPEDVEEVVIVNNDLTLHVKAGTRKVMILAEDFSESAALKAWLQVRISDVPNSKIRLHTVHVKP